MENLSDEDKMSFILKNELIITESVFNGHKAHVDDQFEEKRKLIKQYRNEVLGNDFRKKILSSKIKYKRK